MKTIKILALMATLGSLLFLAGCATYQVDSNQPHAMLGIKNEAMFGNENSVIVFGNNDNCTDAKVLSRSMTLTGTPTMIQADKLITLDSMHTIGYNRLDFAFSFVPKPNVTYWIKTTSAISKKDGRDIGTQFVLEQQTSPNGPLTLASFYPRKFVVGSFSSSCTDNLKDAKLTKHMALTAKDVGLAYRLIEHTE